MHIFQRGLLQTPTSITLYLVTLFQPYDVKFVHFPATIDTLQGINISPFQRHIWRWFFFSQVGYVNVLEGRCLSPSLGMFFFAASWIRKKTSRNNSGSFVTSWEMIRSDFATEKKPETSKRYIGNSWGIPSVQGTSVIHVKWNMIKYPSSRIHLEISWSFSRNLLHVPDWSVGRFI